MKKCLTTAMAIACLVPSLAFAQPEHENPAISQPLVSQGDFAIQLAAALKLGSVATAVEAVSLLDYVGIARKTGGTTMTR